MAKKKKKPEETPRKRNPRSPAKPAAPVPESEAPEDAATIDESAAPESALPFPVVGIVASAGGLDAFKKFFKAMPPTSGIAFVLVPHLDPHHESLMSQLMAKQTSMPVAEAKHGMAVEPDHVYLIPPSKFLSIHKGKLRLTEAVANESQTAMDLFLRSLANDQQDRAIGIILSGTGSHGSAGVRAIKAVGGMAMVQAPETAQYHQMPESAVATGLADFVLPVEQMPRALLEYVGVDRRKPEADETLPGALERVLALLRTRAGLDFRSYRKKTVLRRIERRMSLTQAHDMEDYLGKLRDSIDEARRLARDMLISVTCFFRDPEAFALLETQVIAPLIEDKDQDQPVRVWVPGCATGEEVYSLAMLLLEQLSLTQKACRLQIFATDLDTAALEVARRGVYPESIAAEVSPERLRRFFTRIDNSSYQVNKQVREAITFAVQNLIYDPPFSRMDLISCRNLLIYLEPEFQRKILSIFHFALVEDGGLFLGTSETIGKQTDLFQTVSKKWRLFRRLADGHHEHLEIIEPLQIGPAPAALAGAEMARRLDPAELTRHVLLQHYAPSAVLVNRSYQIQYFYGSTSEYLDQPTGEPSQNLMVLAREGLRMHLRAGIQKALREQATVAIEGIRTRRGEQHVQVMVKVRPVKGAQSGELALVTFEDMPELGPQAVGASAGGDEPLVKQLEYELKSSREDLQSTIEDLESSNEELKAANEEVMSMNEEMQSSNEELETSREELQSLNEELATVNSQLQDKVEELERANNDLANFLSSSDIGAVFLDMEFRIQRFTPAATRLFNLIASDVGRPLSDIAQKCLDSDLMKDCQEVASTLLPRQHEVRTEDNHWFLRRILPYRTTTNKIEGVVLTFFDVTQQKQAAERQRFLATVLTVSNDAVLVHELSGKLTAWNRGAERMYGYSEAEATNMNVADLVPAAMRKQSRDVLRQLTSGKPVASFETQRKCKDGRIVDIWATMTALTDNSGTAVATTSTERDITDAKQRRQHLERLAEELAEANKKLEAEIAERLVLQKKLFDLVAQEQRRIGHDLHDSVGQELAGLSMMSSSLTDALARQGVSEVELGKKISAGLKRALSLVRTLSRGLLPVEVDEAGLMTALQELTRRLSEQPGLVCRFHCPQPVAVEDNVAATHLYRIAQEAATNAMRHGHAHNIEITLLADKDGVTLRIEDDGNGFDASIEETKGMGLRIMRYRAGLLGAELTIRSGDGQGAVVTCGPVKDQPAKDQTHGEK